MPSLDYLVTQIRQHLAGHYEPVFAEFVRLKGTNAERKALCVFHDNRDTPAMSVNVEEGLYLCHNPSCGAKGDIFDFIRRVRSLTFEEAVYELAARCHLDVSGYRGLHSVRGGTGSLPDVPALATVDQDALIAAYDPTAHHGNGNGTAPANTRRVEGRAPATPEHDVDRRVDEEIVHTYHERLLATQEQLDFLATRRGFTIDTVVSFELGHDGQRYTIPIRDSEGIVRNLRRYKPDATRAHEKMISWRTGYGEARLFPIDRLEPDGPIYLLEGETDTMLARQLGLNALTGTGGSGTWRDAWAASFRNREVVVCYDCDAAGKAGALNVARELHGVASSIKVVTLPLAEDGADFTDYIVRHGHTKEDFCALVAQTPIYAPSERDTLKLEDREPVHLHLSKASEAAYYNTPIRVGVMVSGKTTAPYLVPQEVKLSCRMPGLKMCERCPVAKRSGSLVHKIEFATNEVLQFINTTDASLNKQIRGKVGVPGKCTYVNQDVLNAMNVEEIHLIPEVERGEGDAPYVTRASFFLGHGLQANRSYVMTGVTVPEPKRQLATHLIYKAIPSQSNIDAFKLTEQVVDRLKVFQPTSPGVDGLWEHLDRIYDDLETVTSIFERRDLMMAVDMTYHSITAFEFQGNRLRRGWTEALIVGDSRTGKSTVVERMVAHYGAGELTTGENTSFAGLVGGLEQVGNSWSLRWGRVPLNDRRLLVIDEAGNLSQEHIGRMSSMRSSGVAEVIKIHTERTLARTRQIWISNPRGNRSLSSYSQGVVAIKELIGAPEDIARFDMVVTAASTDVPLAVVNLSRARSEPQTFTSDLCHQRVMWAWSRMSQHVEWADGTEQEILRIAGEHGERYRHATEIPLVEPNEQRIKLARLSVAVAAMFFSTDDTGMQVIVKPEHAQLAAQFLETLYRKPSLAFDEYASGMKRRNELGQEDEVRRIVTRNGNAVRALLEQEIFSQRDLAEIFEYDDRQEMRMAITLLRDSGFLRKGANNNYAKTPGAIRWLRTELERQAGRAMTGDGFQRRGAAATTQEQAIAQYATHNGRGSQAERDEDDIDPPW